MAGNFPTSVTNYTNPTNDDSTNLVVGARKHGDLHADNNDDLEQIMTKLGAGVSSPTADTVLKGVGTGVSAYGQIVDAEIADGADISIDKLAAGTQDTFVGTPIGASAVVHRVPPRPVFNFQYSFDTTVIIGEPPSGSYRLNNASVLAATQVLLSGTDARGANAWGILSSMIGTAPYISIRGVLRIQSTLTPGDNITYRVTNFSLVGASGTRFIVDSVVSNGSITNGEIVEISYSPVGFDNPMTANDDVIIGGASGVATRLAKGSNSRVFGVDAAGVLGYRQVTNADIAPGAGGTVFGTQYGTSTVAAQVPPTPALHYQFSFDTTTTVSEPAAGRLRLNNASQAAAGLLMLAATDQHGYSITAGMSVLAAAPNRSTNGLMRLQSISTPANWILFRISAYSTLSSGFQYIIGGNAVGSSASPFANNEIIELTYTPTGFDNPMSTTGDLIVGGASGLATRLVKGANRTSLITDNSGVVGWAVAATRSATLTVAASNASAAIKAVADYICDGSATSNDQVEINAALAALPTNGGTVMLSEGVFYINDTIVTAKMNSTLMGQGHGATNIIASSTIANVGIISLSHNYCALRNVYVDGAKGGGNSGKTSVRNWVVNGADCIVDSVVAVNSPGNGCDIQAGGTRTKVSNCIITGTQFVALVISSNNCIIVGNQVYSNLSDGIYLNASYNLVVGNESTINTNNGITVTAIATYNFVEGNYCTGNGNWGINALGTGNKFGINYTANNTLGDVTTAGSTSPFRAVATADVQANAISQALWVNINGSTTNTSSTNIEPTGIPMTTTGGDILAWLTFCGHMTANGNAAYIGLAMDGAADVVETVTVPGTGTSQFSQTVFYRWNAPAAGLHTIRGKFHVSASTYNGFNGQIMVVELKK